MAKKSKAYWVKRAEALENRANDKGEALAKKFKREYERAAKEIRAKIDAFYGRYATEQGLSYAEAVKRLNSKEAREWKKTLGEYVDEINAMPKGKAKDKLIAELDARSYASQQDRLSSLNAQIEMELDRLFASGEQQMTATMTDVFEDGYYRKVFDLQQRTGVISPFTKLSTDMIEDVLTYPWSGSDFSTRLWNNKRALLFNARETITQGLIQGQSVARMSKSLADAMGKSYHQAETLIRTETNNFHAQADVRAYEAAGVEEYEFVATLDSHTSEICASLDGKHFPIKEAKTGVNYPPMHPRCRSTTVEYDPEDAADWAASGQPMPENMTYEEWAKELEIEVSTNDQDFRPVTIDLTDEVSFTRKHGKIMANRAMSTKNDLYLSKNAKVKPKQLHNIDQSLTEARDILKNAGIESSPIVVLVDSSEMDIGVVGSFNAKDNILRIDAKLGIKNELEKLQKGSVVPDNPLSTYLHELIHSFDSVTYRKKYGAISDNNYNDYLEWANEKAEKAIEKLEETGYNINEISEYASKNLLIGNFDEAYTEYRVKKLLGGA
jgi:SPP1 gp7 family putative phage head morphogenesis protein